MVIFVTDLLYLIYLISFVLGSIVGLLLSYKKYSAPFVTEKIDVIALIVAVVGWFILLNNMLIPLIPPMISITLGLFMVAMVFGMRPGYGRYETVIGIIISGAVYLLTSTF
jgi:energy-converting hydrogenase A subunit L